VAKGKFFVRSFKKSGCFDSAFFFLCFENIFFFLKIGCSCVEKLVA
jgi:hypothetical protein